MALNLPGYKFAPSDYEIITYYLVPKTQDEQHIEGDMIPERAVYAVEPQSLDWTPVPYLKNHERYYFVKRERLATKTGGRESKRAKRTLESEAGFWKLSTGKHMIKDHQGTVVGVSSSLNYYTYQDPTKKDRDQALKSTRWLMTEYKLPGDDFQEWVVCKIKDKQRENQVQPPLYHEASPRVQLQAAPPEEEEEQQQKDDLYGILMDVADEVINADPQDLPYFPEPLVPQAEGQLSDSNAEDADEVQPVVQQNRDPFAIATLPSL